MLPLDVSLFSGELTGVLGAMALPIVLLGVVRVPSLAKRNAIQFSIAAMIMVALWLGGAGGLVLAGRASVVETATGGLILGSAISVYLEIWAPLSRGYTLALLITLSRIGAAAGPVELAAPYRGGEGLGWIMRHRLAGLIRARFVEQDADMVRLTPVLGYLVAVTCNILMKSLGLRRTG